MVNQRDRPCKSFEGKDILEWNISSIHRTWDLDRFEIAFQSRLFFSISLSNF